MKINLTTTKYLLSIVVATFLLPPITGLNAQEHEKKKEDPVKMLEEIQKKMEEAELLLSRSAAGAVGGSGEVDRVQRSIERRMERLLEQGKKQEEIVEELNKFLDRKKRQMEKTGEQMSEAVKEIDKLLNSQNQQQQAVEQIQKILESQKKMEEAMSSIDKVLENATNKHNEALGTIEKLIKMAQQSQSQSSSMTPEMKPGEKPKDEQQKEQEKPLDPENANKKPDHNTEKHPIKPEDKKDEDKENNANDNDRWGDLPGRGRENLNGLDTTKLPPRYKYLIEQYHKKLNDQQKKNK